VVFFLYNINTSACWGISSHLLFGNHFLNKGGVFFYSKPMEYTPEQKKIIEKMKKRKEIIIEDPADINVCDGCS